VKRGVDIPALVGGLVTVGLGLLLLLDRVSVLHLGFGWLWPALLAAVGTFLIASGWPARGASSAMI
jgi:hypothetical protein